MESGAQLGPSGNGWTRTQTRLFLKGKLGSGPQSYPCCFGAYVLCWFRTNFIPIWVYFQSKLKAVHSIHSTKMQIQMHPWQMCSSVCSHVFMPRDLWRFYVELLGYAASIWLVHSTLLGQSDIPTNGGGPSTSILGYSRGKYLTFLILIIYPWLYIEKSPAQFMIFYHLRIHPRRHIKRTYEVTHRRVLVYNFPNTILLQIYQSVEVSVRQWQRPHKQPNKPYK